MCKHFSIVSCQINLHQVSDVNLPPCSAARVGAPVIAMTGMRSAYEPAIPLTAIRSANTNVVTNAASPLRRA